MAEGMRGLTKENPLTHRDLPFTVPLEASYWIATFGREAVETPVAPAGSVLELNVGRRVATDAFLDGNEGES